MFYYCYAPRLLSIGQLSILQNNYHFGSPSSIDKNVSVFIKEGTKTVRKPLVSLSQLKLRWRVVIPFLWATSATATKNSSFDGKLTRLTTWTSVSAKKLAFLKSQLILSIVPAGSNMMCSVHGTEHLLTFLLYFLGRLLHMKRGR